MDSTDTSRLYPLWNSNSNKTESSEKHKRKVLQQQSREIAANVYDFLKADGAEILKIVSNPQYNAHPVLLSDLAEMLRGAQKRTALAVGVSEQTISKILRERKKGQFMSPLKDRKKRKSLIELTEDNVNLIRSTIENYQSEHNEAPTIKTLFPILKEKLNYTGQMGAFRKVLLTLGYKWQMKNGKPEFIDFSSAIKLKTEKKDEIVGEKLGAKKPKKKTKLNEIHAKKTEEKKFYVEIETASSTQPTQNNFNLKREFVDPSYEHKIGHLSTVTVELIPSAETKTNENQKYIMKTEIVNENWDMHTKSFN